MSEFTEYQRLRIEALEKELQKYKEICEQFQNRYTEVKTLNIEVINPVF